MSFGKRYRLSGADFDEVSTVDTPANQPSLIVLAKRATAEETTMEYFDADGQPVDIDDLEVGTLVQGDDGLVYAIREGDEAPEDNQETDPVYDGVREQELAGVGKSAFFGQAQKAGDDLFAALSKSLESAIADDAQRSAIAKAFADQQTKLEQAQATATEAVALAKGVIDEREEDRFVELAKGYDLPVAPETLGPVLHRMTKAMSYQDCKVIASVLENSTDIFKAHGLSGEGDPNDPTADVERFLAEQAEEGQAIAKRNGGGELVPVTKEAGTVAFFDANPRAYSDLKRQR